MSGAVTTKHLKSDLLASVVVFLVALPLCLGIAIASGVPVAYGLITGIIGGLVVGSISGSPLQVSGPAAGLAVVVLEIVQDFGLTALGPILLAAGILQMLAGGARLGVWFRAVPPSVVYGMLGGIGALLVGSQFHVMLDDGPRGSGLENLLSIPEAIYEHLIAKHDESLNKRLAAGLGILSVFVMVAWPKLAPKKLKALPAPLIAVLVAAILAEAFDLGVKRVNLPESFFSDALSIAWLSHMPHFEWGMVVAAIGLAIIASAETLLSAAAVDKMHDGERCKYDKELFSQGVGNTICGFLGALPMTGVIVRSSANVQAGAKTRLSAILHGAWMLAFIAIAPGLLERIPLSALAAILVFTGYKLIDQKVGAQRLFGILRAYGRGEVLVYVLTVAAIVSTDLLKGVAAGIVMTIVKQFARLTHLEIEQDVQPKEGVTVISFKGAGSFWKLPRLLRVLEGVTPNHELHIRLDGLTQIDHAWIEAIMNWDREHRARGGTVTIDWGNLELRTHYAKNSSGSSV